MKLIKPFGPTIGKEKMRISAIDKLNQFSDKVIQSKTLGKNLDNSNRLIATMTQQFKITKKILDSGVKNEIERAVKLYYLNTVNTKVKKIRIDHAWVVSQYAGDFNPPHIHRGNISGVGYLKIPQTITNGREKKLAGHISFMDGRVSMPRNSPPLVQHRQTFKPKTGNLFIFPSFLMHDVHPFRGDGERRSFSFNAFVDS